MKRTQVAYGLVLALTLATSSPLAAEIAPVAQIVRPEQFFGFKIGTDGELARYPKVVEYLQHLAKESDRVRFQELGKTTLGNPYVLATFSSPANLARLDRLVEINRALADPRGLSAEEAARMVNEGRPFYFLYATIHSTEVGNGQAIVEIAHRLATESSPRIQEILDNAVLLMAPSQNPDGQLLVIDHWYKTKGTSYNRTYPDLYHHYVGHDDNRDWFMFTQKETRLNVEKVQNVYRPQVTHDMHQQGQFGSRIFVPPFQDPHDPNFHPILAQEQAQIGLAMAAALVSEGKGGVAYNEQYDLWTPARQYMVYHGQPRILTEIASANLADPLVNPAGRDKPLGPQERRVNFPLPYTSGEWRLGQIVEYGTTAVFAGLAHLAKYRTTWLENFYKVHRDWVSFRGAPYAFVIPAEQRDAFETYELLSILEFGDVEIHRARSAFSAGGKTFGAGSFVVKLAQPYGAFAKTMLEKQIYPDLRRFPGGPPIPPYDVTGHTLGMLMGVAVESVEKPFEADLDLLKEIAPPAAGALPRPRWAYLIGPESNAGFTALARLSKEHVPVFRASAEFTSGGKKFAPGAWVVPAGGVAARVLESVSRETGLSISGADQAPAVAGFRMKSPTRIGLWKAANNMPAGWLKWLFEQYGFQHERIASTDFKGALSARYDVIVLPSGTSRRSIVEGLDRERHDASWEWAYGVGEAGWEKLASWVREGGTLVAIGSAVETAVDLLALPLEKVLPDRPARPRPGPPTAQREEPKLSEAEANRRLRASFQSPASLIQALQERVVDPTSLFYCPGSLLRNQFDPTHPLAYGMPAEWPVFFEHDQAYRLRPGFGMKAEVVGRYPKAGPILESGWLLGEDFLRDQLNVVAFEVGRGKVVALGSQVDFRTQPRATFKLLFNAIFQGPAARLSPAELGRLASASPGPTGQ